MSKRDIKAKRWERRRKFSGGLSIIDWKTGQLVCRTSEVIERTPVIRFSYGGGMVGIVSIMGDGSFVRRYRRNAERVIKAYTIFTNRPHDAPVTMFADPVSLEVLKDVLGTSRGAE